MTYPPQPGPYGGSGGYGQPYPGQHSQPDYRGQFPNQPYQGQYGGYGQPYPGQPGGYGQPYPHQWSGYGMPPRDVPPPPEPPKRGGKTGLVVGSTLALVLLAGAAVAVTGFWAPGFFRDDTVGKSMLAADTSPSSSTLPPSTIQQPENAAPTTTSEAQRPAPDKSGESDTDTDEIRRITEAVVDGINNRDAATVKPVSCDPSNERQADYDGFPDDLTVTVSGEPRIKGNSATVALTLRRTDSSKTVTLSLRRPHGSAWCASGINS
ncbi:MAG: hypothetical protein GEV04_05560 [Actinophytocola sp.]|nr:hypothetical protein [Actinophytocola sp.]